jgi:hypothetical protein
LVHTQREALKEDAMTTTTVEAVRAEALFVSTLQCSEGPAADAVRDAVRDSLRALGRLECAARVALEFGEHPETAVGRMNWALQMVRSVYPTRPIAGAPLLLAS